jgi:hypothetical protein
MVKFKQRCYVCKNNWALVSSGRQKFVVCKDCEMKVVDKKVEKKTYAKLFDIPREWYEENGFLRSIRYSYGKWGSLTERQLEAFKKTVKELKKEAKKK